MDYTGHFKSPHKNINWWFPVWFIALRQIFESGRINTGYAVFNSEEDATEYIKRRYNVITSEKYEERG